MSGQTVRYGAVGELHAAGSAAWSLAGLRPDQEATLHPWQRIPGVKRMGLNDPSNCVLDGFDIGGVDRVAEFPGDLVLIPCASLDLQAELQ